MLTYDGRPGRRRAGAHRRLLVSAVAAVAVLSAAGCTTAASPRASAPAAVSASPAFGSAGTGAATPATAIATSTAHDGGAGDGTAPSGGGTRPGESVTDPDTVTDSAPATTAADSSPAILPPAAPTTRPTTEARSSTTATAAAPDSPAGPASTTATEPGAGIAVTAADRSAAARIVARLSTADKAASVIMATGTQTIGTGLLKTLHLGGVILFAPAGVVDGTAGGTPAQVAAVTARLRTAAAGDPTGLPPLIGTDQEYGLVQRLVHGFTDFPDAAQLGRIPSIGQAASITGEIARAAAQEMRAVGVSVDFAPVFGVLPAGGAASAIGRYDRSYGVDPQRVAALVAAAVAGYQRGGVVSAMKHFPGLARVGADSHVTLPTLPVSCANWNAHEAIPAKAGIKAGALMVMTSHLLLPAAGDTKQPASISGVIVDGLLKGSGVAGCAGMNFAGVAVTDSLQMAPITDHYDSAAAAVAALKAGEDLLLMPVDPAKAAAGIVAAVKSGALPAARLDAAATAVAALRIASARVATPALSVVDSAAHRALAARARAAGAR